VTPRHAGLEPLLLALTGLPTVAGREGRVIEFVRRWAEQRPDVAVSTDDADNLTFSLEGPREGVPVYLTAHLDHPAFVVHRAVGPGTIELAFRGGVMDDYFQGARVEIITHDNRRLPGTLIGRVEGASSLAAEKHFLCELDRADGGITPNDMARWLLPEPAVEDGLLRTHACDDLAAAACALEAFDRLRARRASGATAADGRLLFTRAEEVGFVGAIAAVRQGTIPQGAKVVALENSRAFPEAPIGGGPIVRVGDRLTVFSPRLTDDVARIAEEIAGGPATPTSQQKAGDLPAWKWQRKLMAGGACEATVFCHAGLDATCVCLPLGNYHNMAELDAVQAGTNTGPARVGPEFIAVRDAEGMVDLLAACFERLGDPPMSKTAERIERLWTTRRGVLDESLQAAAVGAHHPGRPVGG
jgi:endoglucanase